MTPSVLPLHVLLLLVCFFHFSLAIEEEVTITIATTEADCFTGSWKEIKQQCLANDCCTTSTSCSWSNLTKVTICPYSCQGDYACDFWTDTSSQPQQALSIVVGKGSCVGDSACQQYGSRVASYQIGDGSCQGVQVCQDADASVGSNSCFGYRSCANIGEAVDDDSCHGSWACLPGVDDITLLSKIMTNVLIVAAVIGVLLLVVDKYPKLFRAFVSSGRIIPQQQAQQQQQPQPQRVPQHEQIVLTRYPGSMG